MSGVANTQKEDFGKQKVAEDFRVAKSKSDRENPDFVKFVADSFARCYDVSKEYREEYEYHQKLYRMTEPIDFFGVAADDKDKQKLFRSMILSKATDSRSALMTDSKPKVTFNPIFKENAMQTFMQNLQSQAYPEWVLQAVQTAGTPQGFFDYIIDNYFDHWWDVNDIKLTMYTANKDSILAGKTWFECSRDDGNIFVKNSPFSNVLEDCDVLYAKDRKYIFSSTVLPTRDIERQFNLKKGSLKGEDKYSDRLPKYKEVHSEKWNDKYSVPKARLVIGYFSDQTEADYTIPEETVTNDAGETLFDDGGSPIKTDKISKSVKLYPNGRIITFVCGQDAAGNEDNGEDGVQIIKDEINRYSSLPIVDFIPNPENEIYGKPVARDLANNQMLADRALQQSVLSNELMGTPHIFYRPDMITDIKKISNKIGAAIPVSDPNGIRFEPGIPTINEGVSLYQLFVGISRDISGITEAAEGKRMPNVSSGRAVIAMSENTAKMFRPAVRFFEQTLKKIFTVWSEMFLEIANTGFEIKLGGAYKESKTLPFNLSDFIESFTCIIVEDSSIPRDELTKANQMLMLANTPFEDGLPGADRVSVMEALGIDNAQQIHERVIEGAGIKQQMQQMQQTIQQQADQLAQMQKALEQTGAENQSYQGGMAKEQIRAQSELTQTHMDNQTSLVREQMKQQGKERQIAIKAAMEPMREAAMK